VLIIEDRAIVTSVLVAFYKVSLHEPSEPVLLATSALQIQDRSPQSRHSTNHRRILTRPILIVATSLGPNEPAIAK